MTEIMQESVSIPGPRRLAGELAYPFDQPRASCLIVNPHPYMGGRMDNNIVAALGTALPAAGIATLRFDYSGVGASEGSAIDVTAAMSDFWSTGDAPIDPLMVDDAKTALCWLRRQAPAPLFIIGYSFGAYVASRIAPSDLCGLVLVSPTIKHHTINLAGIGAPTLVLHSDNDFVADLATYDKWLAPLSPSVQHHCMRGGEHFFIGLENSVAEACVEFIGEVLGMKSEALA
jgi:alpha/beta superfamily hydrolase